MLSQRKTQKCFFSPLSSGPLQRSRTGFWEGARSAMSHTPVLQWLSAVAGIFAAALWFWSASIRVYPGSLYGGVSPEQMKLMNRQSRLNAWAAVLTGVSVGL